MECRYSYCFIMIRFYNMKLIYTCKNLALTSSNSLSLNIFMDSTSPCIVIQDVVLIVSTSCTVNAYLQHTTINDIFNGHRHDKTRIKRPPPYRRQRQNTSDYVKLRHFTTFYGIYRCRFFENYVKLRQNTTNYVKIRHFTFT